MAGKFCTGAVTGNAFNPQESKAYSEGMYHRAKGSAASYPSTDNPHESGSSAGVAWLAGWTLANTAGAGSPPVAIADADAPCVAVPDGAITA